MPESVGDWHGVCFVLNELKFIYMRQIQIIDLTPDVCEAKRIELEASTQRAMFKSSFVINGNIYLLTFRGVAVATFKTPENSQEYKIKFF